MDYETAIKAIRENPANALIFADYFEEQGEIVIANSLRANNYYKDYLFNNLMSQTITSIDFNDSQLSFNKRFNYEVFGDCCSTAWFFRFRGIDKIINQKVLLLIAIDTSDVNIEDGLCRQEYDSAYGYGLVTTGGLFEMVFRNSSNGYYGGYWESARKLETAQPLLQDWEYHG